MFSKGLLQTDMNIFRNTVSMDLTSFLWKPPLYIFEVILGHQRLYIYVCVFMYGVSVCEYNPVLYVYRSPSFCYLINRTLMARTAL